MKKSFKYFACLSFAFMLNGNNQAAYDDMLEDIHTNNGGIIDIDLRRGIVDDYVYDICTNLLNHNRGVIGAGINMDDRKAFLQKVFDYFLYRGNNLYYGSNDLLNLIESDDGSYDITEVNDRFVNEELDINDMLKNYFLNKAIDETIIDKAKELIADIDSNNENNFLNICLRKLLGDIVQGKNELSCFVEFLLAKDNDFFQYDAQENLYGSKKLTLKDYLMKYCKKYIAEGVLSNITTCAKQVCEERKEKYLVHELYRLEEFANLAEFNNLNKILYKVKEWNMDAVNRFFQNPYFNMYASVYGGIFARYDNTDAGDFLLCLFDGGINNKLKDAIISRMNRNLIIIM